MPRKGQYKSSPPINHIMAEGNNGGSYIDIRTTGRPGIVRLEVGETCVQTVDEEIPVVALAAILTHAKHRGWEQVLRDFGWDAEHARDWLADDPIQARDNPRA